MKQKGGVSSPEGPGYQPSAEEQYPQFFALLEKISGQLHEWIHCAEIPSPTTALGYVQVGAAIRAWNIFRSIRVLLGSNHWEDALILVRSLFELLLSIEEIHRDTELRERNAKMFLLFNELQLYLHARADRQYQIDTGRLAKNDELLGRLDDTAKKLFAVFLNINRKKKEFWQRTWCGKNAYDLAQRSANPIRVNQYKVLYSYTSAFAHSSPLSVMSTATHGKEWKEFVSKRNAIEEDRTLMVVSFTVPFLLEVLFHVGHVFPGYKVVWTFEVLTDLYRLHDIPAPPLSPEVAAAMSEWGKGRGQVT